MADDIEQNRGIRRSVAWVSWRTVVPLALALASGIAGVYILWVLVRPIAFLILGITLAEALAPLVDWLDRWIPRTLTVTIVFLVLAGVVAAIAWLVLPTLIDQVQALAQQAPTLLDRARSLFQRWDQRFGLQASDMAGKAVSALGNRLVTLPITLVTSLADALVIVFIAIYWLIGKPGMLAFALSFFPEDRRDRASSILEDMGQAMGGYVRGAAINAVIMGALAWLGLTIIGVHYSLALGVLTMLGEPIPYLGPVLAAVPVIGAALLQSFTKALLAIALYTLLQQIEGHLLTPNIMKSQTHVPQTLVIFALVAGAAVGGLLGILVALPSAGAARVFFLRVVAPWIRQRTGAPEPAAEPT